MNVLMISGDKDLIAGKKGAFYKTLLEFSKYWEKIDVWCPGMKRYKSFSPIKNVNIAPMPLPKFLGPLLMRFLSRRFKKNNWDLIITHDYGLYLNGITGSSIAKKLKIAHISEIHHIEGHPIAASIKDRISRYIATRYIKKSKKSVTSFRVVEKSHTWPFLLKLGVPNDKIKFLPSLNIDLNQFTPKDTECRYDILMVGRLFRNKGHISVLNVIAKMKFMRPRLKVLFLGKGPMENKLRRKIKALGLERTVFIKSWVESAEDLRHLYNQSRVLICASTCEGGPRVVAEAMACGLPVVSTKVGIVPEIIDHGITGLTYDGSEIGLKKVLNYAFDNTEDLKRMSLNGLKRIQLFEYSSSIQKYAQTYHGLV